MSDAAPVVDQVEFWNGDVGRKWAANQERLDRAFASLTQGLVEAAVPSPGERVLDIGCGAGELTVEMARRVGHGGFVLGLDISRPMLERARTRSTEGGAAIEWLEGDASTYSFTPGRFDLAVSRFGVMFFADPVAAFRNIRAALRPGGRLVMLCWRTLQENEWVSVPRTAMLQVLPVPAPMPPDAPGPFAFANPARVSTILTHAGFADVRSNPLNVTMDIGNDPEACVRFLVELGPASALLRGADDAQRPRAEEAVREAVNARAASGQPVNRGACWLFSARNG